MSTTVTRQTPPRRADWTSVHMTLANALLTLREEGRVSQEEYQRYVALLPVDSWRDADEQHQPAKAGAS